MSDEDFNSVIRDQFPSGDWQRFVISANDSWIVSDNEQEANAAPDSWNSCWDNKVWSRLPEGFRFHGDVLLLVSFKDIPAAVDDFFSALRRVLKHDLKMRAEHEARLRGLPNVISIARTPDGKVAVGSDGNARAAKVCGECNKPNCELRCGGCRQIRYCDRVCQSRHWGQHKHHCTRSVEAQQRAAAERK